LSSGTLVQLTLLLSPLPHCFFRLDAFLSPFSLFFLFSNPLQEFRPLGRSLSHFPSLSFPLCESFSIPLPRSLSISSAVPLPSSSPMAHPLYVSSLLFKVVPLLKLGSFPYNPCAFHPPRFPRRSPLFSARPFPSFPFPPFSSHPLSC